MFKFIEANDLAWIKLHLSDLFLEKRHNIELAARDARGRTLLHVAVERGYLPIVQELLSWDLSVSEPDDDKETPMDIATLKFFKNKNDVNTQKIFCLLKIRQQWQEEFKGFKFNQALRMINTIATNIEAARGFDKVFLMGATGAGKSTLLNYLCGVKYKVEPNEIGLLSAVKIEGQETAKTGKSMISETLYPQVVRLEHLPFVYCDLAGLFDSRGLEERICAINSQYIMSSLPGKIKGIMVCLDIPGFMASRGASFKKVAVAVANLVRANNGLLDCVTFLVTKAPNSKITEEVVINEYINKLHYYYVDLEASKNRELTVEEQALVFMLAQIKERKVKMIVPDICDGGTSSRQIEAIILAAKSQESELFDFVGSSDDEVQKPFQEMLLGVVRFFTNVKERVDSNVIITAQEQKDARISLEMNLDVFENVYYVTKQLALKDDPTIVKFWHDFEPYLNNDYASQQGKPSSVSSIVSKSNAAHKHKDASMLTMFNESIASTSAEDKIGVLKTNKISLNLKKE